MYKGRELGSRSGLPRAGCGSRINVSGHRDLCRVMKTSEHWIMVMVAKLHKCTLISEFVYCSWVNFKSCKLYLNKSAIKTELKSLVPSHSMHG